MSAAAPELYVVVATGPAAAAELGAALTAGGRVAAVLIKAGATALDAASARPLVELAQKASAAALIDGDASLARALSADGVHLPWSPSLLSDYAQARELLGTRCTVGVGIAANARTARHDAMELAEAGADYVGFEGGADDGGAVRGLVNWWAEIFEVPCVAFGVSSPEDAATVAAEFIGVDLGSAEHSALIRAIATRTGTRQREATP